MVFNQFPSEVGVYIFSGILRYDPNATHTILPVDVIGTVTAANPKVFNIIGDYRFLNEHGAGILWYGCFQKLELPAHVHSLPNTNQDAEAYRDFADTLRIAIEDSRKS